MIVMINYNIISKKGRKAYQLCMSFFLPLLKWRGPNIQFLKITKRNAKNNKLNLVVNLVPLVFLNNLKIVPTRNKHKVYKARN